MLRDRHGRRLEDLRISVTDRCNFRCTYCMPLAEYEWLHRSKILSFEEITRSARLFADLGVSKIRLTGGEPLLRQDLPDLVAQLRSIEGIRDLALTTNAARLAKLARPLKDAGLDRVTVSIDSLRPERFRQMTQRGNLEPVLEGLSAARDVGLGPIKLNVVIERGVNDDEILDLVDFARGNGFEARFIEYMDVGNANQWRSAKLVPKREILDVIRSKHALESVAEGRGSAPSADYAFADGKGRVGVIASVTEPFCGDCTRMRLTADGRLVTCLFSSRGHDLKALLRDGSPDERITAFLRDIWTGRTDRYSEQRLVALQSESYDPAARKKIEMISLGG